MSTTKVQAELARIQAAAPDAEVRVTTSLDIGEGIHQGDVYIFKVSPKTPRGDAWGSTQVAVGNTVGSRHVACGSRVSVFAGKELPSFVKLRDWIESNQVLGPVVVAEEEWVLTHPEHAHHQLPAGTYQVLYQADGRTQRAVTD